MSWNLTDANIIDRGHNNYLTPEIWEEMHFREIFYGTLVFQQSSMISVGRHVGLKEDHFTPFAACPSKILEWKLIQSPAGDWWHSGSHI